MKTYNLTESQLNALVADATVRYLVNEGFMDGVKKVGKNAALGAAATLGMGGMLAGNAYLSPDEQQNTELRQSTDEFRYQNLMDKVQAGEISYEEAMDLFNKGKGYNESKKINKVLQTESMKNVIRNVVRRVMMEEKMRG